MKDHVLSSFAAETIVAMMPNWGDSDFVELQKSLFNRFIYLGECKGLSMLKIGSSAVYPDRRLRTFARDTNSDWLLLGCFKASSRVERETHEILAPFRHPSVRSSCREWYRDCPQVRAAFALLMEELA